MCERRERLGGRDYGISSGLAQLIVHNTPRCAEASSMGSETCVFFFSIGEDSVHYCTLV